MKRWIVGLLVIVAIPTALVIWAPTWYLSRHEQFGYFDGTVTTEWVEDRDMTLTKPFSYVDPRGKRWQAPAGLVINGASIPRPFWSFIGGPYEGKYRNASVVHDAACVAKDAGWAEVHQMFYEACRCGGMPEYDAKVLYCAVYNWGPRWYMIAKANPDGSGEVEYEVSPSREPTAKEIERMKEFVRSNPSLDEIQSRDFRGTF